MARVKRGTTTSAKHKRILDQAKGYYGRRKNTIRIARQAVEKAGQYAYRDRKVKKRTFRGLWIQRINAGVRAEGLTYCAVHARAQARGHRARPEGLGRHRDARGRSVYRHRRAGEGGSAPGRLRRPDATPTRGAGGTPPAPFFFVPPAARGVTRSKGFS